MSLSPIGASDALSSLAPESQLLLSLLGKGILVLAGCLLLAALVRRGPAALRHDIGLAGLALLVALPLLAAVMPSWDLALLEAPTELEETIPAAKEASAPHQSPRALQPAGTSAPAPLSPPPTPAPTGIAAGPTGGRLGLAPGNLVFDLWLVGFLLFLGISSLRAGCVHWMVRHRSTPPETWGQLRDRLCLELGLRRRPPLEVSTGAPVPFVLGWLRPRILLPPSARSWPLQRLEMALRHELAHVHRNDHLTRLVVQAAKGLYWPNPLVWLLGKRVDLEREMACDEAVVRAGLPASKYARELLEIARELGRSPWASGSLAMARPSGLATRIRAIVSPPGASLSAPTRLAFLLPLVLLGLVASSARLVVAGSFERPGLEAAAKIERPGSRDSARLAQGLRDGDWEALRSPGPLRVSRRSAEALVLALDDPNAGVRRIAAWALGEARSRSAIEPLRARLQDPDPRVRAAAARSLGDIGRPDPAGDLTLALGDPDPQVRIRAAHALGDLQAPEATEALVSALDDPDPAVVERADWALREILDAQGVSNLIEALGHDEPRVREHAAHFLGDARSARAVAPLVALLSREPESVRSKAVWALGEIADEAAVPALVEVASNPASSLELRAGAIRGLGEIGDGRAGPTLVSLLQSEETALRAQAADALGNLDHASYREPLRELATSDPDPEVRSQARRSLRRLS